MNLHDTFQRIANYLDIDADLLRSAAELDPHNGWDNGAGDWPCGSLWSVEGKVLFALAATQQSDLPLVELGTHYGAGATHLAETLYHNDHEGTLYCIDVWEGAGQLVPPYLQPLIEQHFRNALEWLAEQPDESLRLIFEDIDHSAESCAAIGKLAQQKLCPGGILLSHDAAHPLVGKAVQDGYAQAGLSDAITVLTEPSDCGLLIWRKPVEVIVAPSEPKRKTRGKK